jgi:hypothetical protein
MDHKQAYEQIIAGKLNALPLPDMADAIWSRIEAQLDIELPEDNGGGNDPAPPSGGGWLGRAGLFVFIAAFVTIFLIYKNNKKIETLAHPRQTTQPAPTPTSIKKVTKSNEDGKGRERPLQQNGSADPVADNSIDSAFALPVTVIPPGPDSVQQTTLVQPSPLPAADSLQLKKNPRGVPGITDNDYRIVPAKKDS